MLQNSTKYYTAIVDIVYKYRKVFAVHSNTYALKGNFVAIQDLFFCGKSLHLHPYGNFLAVKRYNNTAIGNYVVIYNAFLR